MTIATTLDRPLIGFPTELARGRGGGGPAPKRIVVAYGFWIFILSDIIMFSALFAAYAVLAGNTAGGPTGDDVSVAVELHMRDRSVVCRTGPANAVPGLRNLHIRARCGLSVHRGHRICQHGGEGRRALAQRLSLQLLHFSRHARRPCRQRFGRARLSGSPGNRSWPSTGRTAAPVVLEPVLARAGYRLGRRIHARLSDGRPVMNNPEHVFEVRTPGVEEHEPTASYLSYTVGLGLAIIATIASFIVAETNLLWPPGIPVGLIVLAFAQIGVHLVFFLHLGSGPDSTNNILALAFGVLIVFLVIAGSVWIIANLNSNMM